jgi:DNA-binding NarL/FixJ family response regulator
MSTESSTRVLIVDDHAMVREGLRAVFAWHSDLQVIAEAGDGVQALTLYRSLRPDVAIVDLRMPGLGGIELIRAIVELDAQARLLVLTSMEGDADVRAAMAAGASGFLLKGATGDEIIQAVRQVRAGNQWLSSDVRELLNRNRASRELSPREIAVLALVVEGLRNQEIAERLCMALNTVKVHVQSVLTKLDANDRTEAAVIAVRRGIVHL